MTRLEEHSGSAAAARWWPAGAGRAPFEFDLRHVERDRRASVWLEWNAQLFGTRIHPINAPEEDLDGYLRGTSLAGGQFYRMRPAFRRVLRHRAACSGANPDVFTVVVQLAGVAVVRSAGRALTCGPDDVRFHCGDAFEEELSRDSELLLLRLPMALVDAQLPGARALPGQRLGATEPLTRLIRSALLGSSEAGPTLTPAQQDALLKSLIGLLGVPRIETVSSGSDRARQRVQDAVNCVDLKLFDQAFGAPELAGCLHISRRRLDELFVGALGKPVAPYIWERRLHYAGEVLRDPAQQHRTITDVALAHGFGDVAHFARAFKRRFGVTARDWRAGAYRSN